MKQWLGMLVTVAGLMLGMAAHGAPDDRQAVEARAQRLWAAEVKDDWGAVYDLLTPVSREGQTRDEYAANRRTIGPLHYREAKVDEVVLANDVAWVHVSYKFVLVAHPIVPPSPAQNWQVWRKDGDWQAIGPSERELWPRLPPHLRPAADEAALAKRSSEFWQARVARDFKKIYPYLDPNFRGVVPLDEFLVRKSKYLYFTPRMDWAEVDGAAGRVKVLFASKLADPAASKMEPSENLVIEKWVKAGGEWFFDVKANSGD